MRIRYKKWARPELEASKIYINEPEKIKGKWKEQFVNSKQSIHLELGCGKGQFMAQLALENQNKNYLAIDLVDAMLGLAKRNIEQAYQESNIEPKNIRFVHSKINEKPNLILLRGVNNAKEFLKIDKQLIIYKEDGNYTDEILKIYNKI